MSEILIPIAPADLIDRLTRLQLRAQQVTGAVGCPAILHQIAQLQLAADHALPPQEQLAVLWGDLAEANADLFALDADLRSCEERSDFGPGFVALARARIAAQDSRTRIKNRINQLLEVIEQPHPGRPH